MGHIHMLDERTINKIAAGEVVERPASVIKELVENSIDAGSTKIDVEIGDGGISYMRITDNGCGMVEEDARLAVLRHATSKIESVDDLFHIASLGFRGEALASIASVSKFRLLTRVESEEMGTEITIHGGHMIDCTPFGAQPGTSIEVRELFYNTPARRKFLKTERTEASKIQEILGKLALSNPQIAFKLTINDKIALLTPGNGKMLDTVAALYGYKVSDDVFPLSYEADGITITGVVSKPTVLKSSRIWQTIMVNQRIISDKAIFRAIDQSYHALLPKGGHPLVVLQIVVPPETVDINVHPRKSEVKFSDDKPIFKAVYHAILGALDKPILQSTDITHAAVTEIDYDKVFTGRSKGYEVLKERTQDFVEHLKKDGYTPPQRNTYEQSQFDELSRDVERIFSRDLQQVSSRFSQEATPTRVISHRTEYEGYSAEEKGSALNSSYGEEDHSLTSSSYEKHEHAALGQGDHEPISLGNEKYGITSLGQEEHGLIPLGQVADCYILAKKGDDLYIIDQHAAHERVRYDILCKSVEGIPREDLLISRYMEASDDEIVLALEEQGTLLDLGFAVDQGGPSQIRIDSIPIDLVESKVEDILRFVFSYLHDHGVPKKSEMRHEMLAYASCRGAIKAGHTLNTMQMNKLIEDLFHTDKPYVCPHGRPTIIKFTPHELGKLFLRS